MNWATFSFGFPWVLALLPATCFLLWWLGRRGQTPAVMFSSLSLVKTLGQGPRVRAGWLGAVLRWAAVLLIVVALAGPRVDRPPTEEAAKAIDIVLVIDASRSMDTRDFVTTGEPISRLEAVRRVVKDFVDARPQDRIGVIGFAEKPFLLCPLTLDHSWMLESLAAIETSLGTAIGSSVEAGVELLRTGGNDSRVIILITDGLNTSGVDPLRAAERAKAAGVRMHTIAAVTDDGVVAKGFDTHPLFIMAKTTGGRFFQAGNAQTLATIYGEIDQLERQNLRELRSRNFSPAFGLSAGLAFILILVEIGLSATRWLRIP